MRPPGPSSPDLGEVDSSLFGQLPGSGNDLGLPRSGARLPGRYRPAYVVLDDAAVGPGAGHLVEIDVVLSRESAGDRRNVGGPGSAPGARRSPHSGPPLRLGLRRTRDALPRLANHGHDDADVDGSALLGGYVGYYARCRRLQLGVDLRCLDLHEGLPGLDGVSLLHEPLHEEPVLHVHSPLGQQDVGGHVLSPTRDCLSRESRNRALISRLAGTLYAIGPISQRGWRTPSAGGEALMLMQETPTRERRRPPPRSSPRWGTPASPALG